MKEYILNILESFEYRINFKKYWKRRMTVQSCVGGGVRKIYYILWLRRQEAKFSATTGIGLSTEKSLCCYFNESAVMPHGLSGIIIARNVTFVGKVVIYQHVTIAESNKEKYTYIGAGVQIGAGAVILNNVHIGNNVKIGANAVVTHDIPDNTTVVEVPARIV